MESEQENRMSLEDLKDCVRREVTPDSKDMWASSDDLTSENPSLPELVDTFSSPDTEPKTRKISFALFCIRQFRGRADQNFTQALSQILAGQKLKPSYLQLAQDDSFLRISATSIQKPRVQFADHREWLESNSLVSDSVAHFLPFKHATEGRMYTIRLGDLQKIVQDDAWDKLVDPKLCQVWLRMGMGSPTKPSILVKSRLQKFGQRCDPLELSPSFSSNKSQASFEQNEQGGFLERRTNENSSKASQGSADLGKVMQQDCDQPARDRVDSISKKKKISFALDQVKSKQTNGTSCLSGAVLNLSPFSSEGAIMVGQNRYPSKERSPHRGQRNIKTTIELGANPSLEHVMSEQSSQHWSSSEPLSRQSSPKHLVGTNTEGVLREHLYQVPDTDQRISSTKVLSIQASTNPGSPTLTAQEILVGEMAPRSKLGKYSPSTHIAWTGKS